MSVGVSVRRFVRPVALALVATLVFQASPLPVLAAQPAEPPRTSDRTSLQDALAPVKAQIRKDLETLEAKGKDEFVDDLLDRLGLDEDRARKGVAAGVRRFGPQKLGAMILAVDSPVLESVLAQVPKPWTEKGMTDGLTRFVVQGIRKTKEAFVNETQQSLTTGLRRLLSFLDDPWLVTVAPDLGQDRDEAWWEKFFGNSTIVRNFLVALVTVGSIGVAIALAIAGSSAAPVVAVVGALVALIALLNKPAAVLGTGVLVSAL